MQINVNNVNLFYTKKGQGKAIILLHGNGEDHKIFNQLSDKLSSRYEVFCIDSRCHGQSDKSKKLVYKEMANDIYEFIIKLNINKPILYGFSDGGIIGLLLAIKHKDVLSKLIISGANVSPQGIKTKYLFLFRFLYFFTQNNKLKLMIKEPNISKENLNGITVHTLILAGEKDLIKEKHTLFIHNNISRSILNILKKETHSSYVLDNDKLFSNIIDFVNQ